MVHPYAVCGLQFPPDGWGVLRTLESCITTDHGVATGSATLASLIRETPRSSLLSTSVRSGLARASMRTSSSTGGEVRVMTSGMITHQSSTEGITTLYRVSTCLTGFPLHCAVSPHETGNVPVDWAKWHRGVTRQRPRNLPNTVSDRQVYRQTR
ncbi:hypothetical protein BDW69DRAFT_75236 [Aspergillus filifer]